MNCIICGSEFDGVKQVRDLAQCPTCTGWQKMEIPPLAVLEAKLKRFLLSACWIPGKDKKRLDNAVRDTVEPLNTYGTPGHLFDIGAAGGFIMQAARRSGWMPDGNELSVAGIAWAKKHYGLDVMFGEFESLDLEQKYRAVTLWNTLEHCRNPRTTIAKAHEILIPEGVVFIKVPIKEYTSDVMDRYEAHHMVEFTRKSLEMVMDTGFTELETWEENSHSPHAVTIWRKTPS